MHKISLALYILTLFLLTIMFDFSTLVKGLFFLVGGALTVGAIIYIVRLTLSEIMGWFQERSHLTRSDASIIGVTIRETLEKGQFSIVQGVFNSRTKSMIESRTIKTDELDDELLERHRYQQRVVYSLR